MCACACVGVKVAGNLSRGILLLLLPQDKDKKKSKRSLLGFSSLQIIALIVTSDLYANSVIITVN